MEREDKYRKRILTIPNVLSFFRIAMIPFIVWLYLVKDKQMTAGFLIVLSGLTDLVDGFIARKFQMISDLGKILDPIADKLTQGAVLLCLLIRFPLVSLPLMLLIIKELYMAVSGMLVICRTGRVLSAEWHGKIVTALLYGVMLLHVFWSGISPEVSAVSIVLCAGMILVSFALYAVRNTRALRDRKKEGCDD